MSNLGRPMNWDRAAHMGISTMERLRYKRRTSVLMCRTSLRADEIKLRLTPSAKQRLNPCSGLPAVYPDLSTCHDWPVKKGLCFVCRDRQSGWRGIRNALPVIRWVRWGPEQGSLRCFADGTNQSLVIVCTQASEPERQNDFRDGKPFVLMLANQIKA